LRVEGSLLFLRRRNKVAGSLASSGVEQEPDEADFRAKSREILRKSWKTG
jgi:hypothetical protein